MYSIIGEIGKEKIQSDVTSDIGLSRYYIQMIMGKCERHIGVTDEETTGSLCEALLHFMLTVCTLPSSRKVQINNVDLDIVIPNINTLKNFPDRAIVIQISKGPNEMNEYQSRNFIQVQPNDKNLWIISKHQLSKRYINYIVKLKGNTKYGPDERNFSHIIYDIHKFLNQTGDKSLRFFPTT